MKLITKCREKLHSFLSFIETSTIKIKESFRETKKRLSDFASYIRMFIQNILLILKKFIKRSWQLFIDWWSLPRIASLLIFFGGMLGLFFTFAYDPQGEVSSFDNFLDSISPELIGIGITVLFIDALNDRRSNQLEKNRLLSHMASPHNATATQAVEELRINGWLSDGSLRDGVFIEANLANTYLNNADLCRANLNNAILTGADLTDANLSGAKLAMALFDQETILPDGSRWAEEKSLTPFTGSPRQGISQMIEDSVMKNDLVKVDETLEKLSLHKFLYERNMIALKELAERPKLRPETIKMLLATAQKDYSPEDVTFREIIGVIWKHVH
ncbi:MAG: pentapeptide repeat-containing protein [Chloroflexota bacterium]